MSKRITIDPVTRIEGHAKITIHLDDSGHVEDARFHVTEFRGFEKFCEGRPLWEMAGITARVCGICPVSHLLASAKAGDAVLSVDIPPAAEKLRRMMNLGQIIQSHALSFFHLSSPDLLLGFDVAPEKRNIFGLITEHPEAARNGIRLRQFGQRVIEILGGKKIHPAWAVPGGVRSAPAREELDLIKEQLPEMREIAVGTLKQFKKTFLKRQREAQIFGNFPTLFAGLVAPDGSWEHYDGCLRFVDSGGNVIADELNPAGYWKYIGEAVEQDSYLKSPYYRALGYQEGMYRVGPLARLNICEKIGTPQADAELEEFKDMSGGAVTSSFHYHYARLIEILASIEHMELLLLDPDLTATRLRANAGINHLHGVGVSEAPRGTLYHDYHVDEDGIVKKVNLIIATGQNNLAMNRTVSQIARHYISGTEVPEGMLNRVEAGIRAYDPCLSCSTHAVGRMPMRVLLMDKSGKVLDEVICD